MGRMKILKSLGTFPATCDLNFSRKVLDESYENYILYEVFYNVEKDERVRSLLLVPKNLKKKVPGIVAVHQHNNLYWFGKSELAGLLPPGESLYNYGQELAELGYVVICPDILGFEERRPSVDERRKNSNFLEDTYEFMLSQHYLQKGSSLLAKTLSDLKIATDVLVSCEEVDSNRIGNIGHSMGGGLVPWHAFYDERVKASVASCGFAQVKSWLEKNVIHNWYMIALKIIDNGDMEEVCRCIAPRGIYISTGKQDLSVPYEGLCELYKEVIKVYEGYGCSNRFVLAAEDIGHDFNEKMRRNAYKWMAQIFKEDW